MFIEAFTSTPPAADGEASTMSSRKTWPQQVEEDQFTRQCLPAHKSGTLIVEISTSE